MVKHHTLVFGLKTSFLFFEIAVGRWVSYRDGLVYMFFFDWMISWKSLLLDKSKHDVCFRRAIQAFCPEFTSPDFLTEGSF